MHVPFVLQRVRHTDRPGLFLVLRVDYGAEVADLRPMEGASRTILPKVPFQLLYTETAAETTSLVHSRRTRATTSSRAGQAAEDDSSDF